MSRVRNNSTVSTGACTVRESHLGKPFPPHVITCSVTSVDTMTDVVVPEFRKRSRQGEVIINPMSKSNCQMQMLDTVVSLVTATNSYSETGNSPACNLFQTGFHVATHPAVVDQIERQVALVVTDTYAKIGSPDVATLTELVELKETIGFLMSPVKGMITLTRKLRDWMLLTKRLEERHLARLAKWNKLSPRQKARQKAPEPLKLPPLRLGKFEATDVSSAWLAYRYAIMPLIYTFQDIEALIKKRAEGPKTRATARGKSEVTVSLAGELSSHTKMYAGLTWTETMSSYGSATITTRGGALYEPDWSLMSQLGVQWNRVPAALYEGIPLSFVADWFYNGSVVYDALTAEFRAQKILGSWVSTKINFSITWAVDTVPISGGSISGPGSFLTAKGQWQSRRRASMADVRLKLRLDMNSKRVADGLALLHIMLATAIKRK